MLPPPGRAQALLEVNVADSPIPHPGVRFPPPLLFVAGFLAGWLVHRSRPVPFVAPASAATTDVAGWIVIGVALIVIAWALVTFHRHRTAVYPNQPAARVVRSGPFRLSRNPMYVSFTLLYLGLSLLMNTLVPLIFLPVVIFLLVLLVIRREERYLRSAFPAEYEAYCRDVRRWL